MGSLPRSSQILSSRGQDALVHGSKIITWDILSDLWHPHTNPNGYVSVGVAENVMLHNVLLDYLHANIKLPSKFLTYNDGSMGSKPLREAVSHFLNRHLAPVRRIEAGHILMTNGCSSAIEQLSLAFMEPGEGILLGRPYYGTFIADMSLRTQAEVVPVDFGDVDPLGPDAVAQYEKAAKAFEERSGKRVRAVMLCHPHNPLGRCYAQSVITEMMKFCQSRQLHLISDEIYALSVWENKVDTDSTTAPVPFKSVLSIDPTGIIDPDLVHVLWGMSKDFGANGLRVGAIISQSNPHLHTALIATSLYSFVSGLSDQITAAILRDDEFTDKYIRLNQENLSNCHSFVARQLQKHDIEYEHGCNAGFFLWVNLGKKYLKNNPGADVKTEGHQLTDFIMQKLLDKKVFLASGTGFGCEKPGWFRIVFAHPIPYLKEAMARITSAL